MSLINWSIIVRFLRSDSHQQLVTASWYLIEVISRELEGVDDVGEVSWRSVGEGDNLQAAGQQGAVEDVLLQNTLRNKHKFSLQSKITALLKISSLVVLQFYWPRALSVR